MIVFSLFLFLLLTGCLGLSTDKTQIKQIAKNIEKTIEGWIYSPGIFLTPN